MVGGYYLIVIIQPYSLGGNVVISSMRILDLMQSFLGVIILLLVIITKNVKSKYFPCLARA